MADPASTTSWRESLAARVSPWAIAVLAATTTLHILLFSVLDPNWPVWWSAITAVTAAAPLGAWWVHRRWRAPLRGFLALIWLWLVLAWGSMDAGVLTVNAVNAFFLLLAWSACTYWPLWVWFYKLRKLPGQAVSRDSRPGTGWRGFLARRVWPWVVLAWMIPALLSLLVKALNQYWLSLPLMAAGVVAPTVAWWVRGPERAPRIGFLTLLWAWFNVDIILQGLRCLGR